MKNRYCLVQEKDDKEDGREEFKGKIYSKIISSEYMIDLLNFVEKGDKLNIAKLNTKNEIIEILFDKNTIDVLTSNRK